MLTSDSMLVVCKLAATPNKIRITDLPAADITPLAKRGAVQSYMGAAWGVSAALGPVLGGVLTEKLSWRYCFCASTFSTYIDARLDINIPVCIIGFLPIFFFLKVKKSHGDIGELRRTYDFPGLSEKYNYSLC